MTFLVSWGCASDFLAMLPKFKIAARGQLRFFCGCKNSSNTQELQKLFGQFFLKFQNHVLATWGCASDFLKTLPKFKMAARGQLQSEVRNYSNFTITFPTIWRCAGDFFKLLLKFKMAAPDQLKFFWGGGAQKYKKKYLVNFFEILASHPSNMGMCEWFFKDATKIQNCRHRSHDMEMCKCFLRFYWNSKWPPWINFVFFGGRKNWKI